MIHRLRGDEDKETSFRFFLPPRRSFENPGVNNFIVYRLISMNWHGFCFPDEGPLAIVRMDGLDLFTGPIAAGA